MTDYTSVAGPLWAVTSYFNPVGYRRRRQNYYTFRERLAVPLVAAEVSHTGQFELRREDAEILIQIHGRDVMWQKERLLNVAIAALPPSCTQVAILDCDVVFCRPDWPQVLSEQLNRCLVAQPFETVHYAPPDMPLDDPDILKGDYTRPSVASLLAAGRSPQQVMEKFSVRGPGVRATGHAIAGRRDWLARHGLYDANIIGSGDSSLLAGIYGLYEEPLQYQQLNAHQIRHYRRWAEPLFDELQGPPMGCVGGNMIHLWHGEIPDRGTFQRHVAMKAYDFDPAADIAVDSSGCWRWNSDKPAMHEFVRGYFATRYEDGREATAERHGVLQRAA